MHFVQLNWKNLCDFSFGAGKQMHFCLYFARLAMKTGK